MNPNDYHLSITNTRSKSATIHRELFRIMVGAGAGKTGDARLERQNEHTILLCK